MNENNNNNEIVYSNFDSLKQKDNTEPAIYKFGPIVIWVFTLPCFLIALKSVLEGIKDFEEIGYIIVLTASLMSISIVFPMLRRQYKRKLAKKNSNIQNNKN